MVALNKVQKVRVEYETVGDEKVKASNREVVQSLDQVAKGTDNVTAAEDRGAKAKQRMADVLARQQRSNDMMLRDLQRAEQMERALAAARVAGMAQADAALNKYGGSLGAFASRQLQQAQAMSAATKAANDNTEAIDEQSQSFTEVSRDAGFFTRALSLIAPQLTPIAAGLGALALASGVFAKAYSDLDKLIDLGKQAEHLDLSGPFIKSFEGIGSKLHAEVSEMSEALEQASKFAQDKLGQPNAVLKQISELYTQGYFGGEKPAAMDAAETADTTEQKLRAGLAAMIELQERGQQLAALDLSEKMFGATFTEKVRAGELAFQQIVADLDDASQKEVIKQEQVAHALELSRNIADVKKQLAEAWDVSFDFSGLAVKIDEAWLSILQTVLSVTNGINSGIEAAANFATSLASTVYEKVTSYLGPINSLLDKIGLGGLVQPEAPASPTPPVTVPTPTPVEQPIGYRNTNEMYGPNLPEQHAKAAKAAAQEAASAYDLLIKKTSDRIEELNLEADSVGKTTSEVIKLKLAHDLERAALKDGTAVTDEMRQAWDALGDRLANATERLHESQRALEQTREAQRELGQEFSTFADDLILGSSKIGDAFASLTKTFASNSLKAILTGEGGLAGLYGTAAPDRNQMGGLFGNVMGGKVDFEKIFDLDKWTKAISAGTSDGTQVGLTDFASMSKTVGGLGQAAMPVLGGAAMGYSSGNPLMGALGGGLAGLATGNPVVAIAGSIAGLVGGHYGTKPSGRKKDRDHELGQRVREFASCGDADGLEPVSG